MENNITIPTYIINIPKRKDRLEHILAQFDGKNEFDVQVVEASVHTNGAVGLWMSICRVIQMAIESDEDVIILCEDDHQFTPYYDTEKFLSAIYEAHRLGASFLLGGIIGGYSNMLPLQSGITWIDTFWGTQFVVVFRSFFETILAEPFSEEDVADGKFSEMTSNKFVMYPMISIQKEFGYSDITALYNVDGHLQHVIESAIIRMDKIHEVYHSLSFNSVKQ
ncbi:hypothetical protein [Sphingobacterium sp.]|uniref:hypothetical protein n=1 Tax=Sphingobacterium sp. TaxID=341027 RepID=UPI0028A0DF72|nr:hypothetical protein [Sphingobacterium sp.]